MVLVPFASGSHIKANPTIINRYRGGLALSLGAPGLVATFGVAGAGGRGSGGHCGAEAVGRGSECGHVFLRLEQDDVDLGGEEAAEDHGATQADGDAHGGGLHLGGETSGWGEIWTRTVVLSLQRT